MIRGLSETDLARHVVAFLHDAHWDVFQEVKCMGCVADIVAVQGRVLWVIESKTAFGLKVLSQAHKWTHYAHYVSIATPPARRSEFGWTLLRDYGIGYLAVERGGHVAERFHPRLRRTAMFCRLREALHEQQKSFAPAGSNGGYWSPFKQTCEAVRRKVASAPGITMKELVASIDTHYRSLSTAKSCIVKWAEAGKIPGVRVERDGGRVLLFPEVQEQR